MLRATAVSTVNQAAMLDRRARRRRSRTAKSATASPQGGLIGRARGSQLRQMAQLASAPAVTKAQNPEKSDRAIAAIWSGVGDCAGAPGNCPKWGSWKRTGRDGAAKRASTGDPAS